MLNVSAAPYRVLQKEEKMGSASGVFGVDWVGVARCSSVGEHGIS